MDLILPGLGLVFWTSLAFLAVLFLLKKFAWKPILEGIHEREKKIDDALKSAEAAEKRMAEIQTKNENLLAEAVKERETMLKSAREAAEKIVGEAREKARYEAEKILSQARTEIHNERMKAITEIKNQVGQLSIDIAEKILREKLSDSDKQNERIQSLLNEVNFN
jgi:F-type H+-transporting ATPase subunit b